MSFATLLATRDRLGEFKAKQLLLSHRGRPFLRGSVLVSQLGFGTYRTHPAEPMHHEALLVALQSGVNLIDTAPVYLDGGAEVLVGNVLQELASGGFTRDQYVIVTKAGYLLSEECSRIWPDQFGSDKDGFFSIHPEYLRHSVSQSCTRMRCSGVDVLLLHNPETLLEYMDFDSCYDLIYKAFVALEQMVQGKVIRYYGVSSNRLSSMELAKCLSIPRLHELARQAASELGQASSHFQVIQCPINPIEHQVATLGAPSVLQTANSLNLDVMVNRPLNAIHQGRLVRLARKPFAENRDFESDFSQAIKVVSSLEDQIWTYMEGQSGLTDFVIQTTDCKAFCMGKELASMLDMMQNEDQWLDVLHTFAMQNTRRSLLAFERCFPTHPDFDYKKFLHDYLGALGDLETAISGFLNRREFLQVTMPLFERFGPDFFSGAESHAAAVLRLLCDLPGNPVVLCGMRSRDYVRDATTVLIEEAHPAVSEVLRQLSHCFEHSENPN